MYPDDEYEYDPVTGKRRPVPYDVDQDEAAIATGRRIRAGLDDGSINSDKLRPQYTNNDIRRMNNMREDPDEDSLEPKKKNSEGIFDYIMDLFQ